MNIVRTFAVTPTCRVAFLAAAYMMLGETDVQAQEQDYVVVGAGVAVTPAYQGSDEYRVLPIPAIDIQQGWFFANLRNGIGIAPVNNEHLTIGASAVFVQGYRRSDVPNGIEKLSDGVGARLFASLRTAGFVTTLGATQVVSGGTKGLVADASVSYPIQVSERFTLIPTLGTTWANKKHNDRYFGVSPAESAASGLPRFTSGSGFKDVSGMVTAAYRLSDRVTLSATGGVTALLGNAADSPIVEEEAQPYGLLTLSYRF